MSELRDSNQETVLTSDRSPQRVEGCGTDELFAVADVSKRFDGVVAVDQVSFDLRRGEVHALVGENGAGKSTLIKMVAGLHSIDAGQLTVGGASTRLASPHAAERAGIVMLPQELELFGELSVAEHLFIGRRRPRTRWGGFDWPRMREEARAIFKSLGVTIDPAARAGSLPIASQQLLAIARALAGDARVVIMDEPTASLSEVEAEQLFRVMRDLTARGVGIIYISHRLEEIFTVADRISVMRDGRMISTGTTTEWDPARLIKAMVGRPLAQLFVRGHHVPGDVALEVRALRRAGWFEGIDLIVRRGEVVGLAGLIGAGRTELARTIFGIDSMDGGEVLVHGEPVRIGSPQAALAHGIAYVPEERRSQGLILNFSITRNITFSCLPDLSSRGFVRRRMQQRMGARFAALLGIRGAGPTAPVTRLSGGNQQKVVLAKALAREPSILILDEPTRGIDVGAKAEIYHLIDNLAKQGKAILLISSELPEVLSMADRVLVMRQGAIVAEFDHESATQELVGAAAAGVEGIAEASSQR